MRSLPVAELYFSWVPHFADVGFIEAFHELQRTEQAPATAEFILGFSGQEYPPEHRCWLALRRFALRYAVVDYHEHDGCLLYTSPSPRDS